jgi:hypothetical protein
MGIMESVMRRAQLPREPVLDPHCAANRELVAAAIIALNELAGGNRLPTPLWSGSEAVDAPSL